MHNEVFFTGDKSHVQIWKGNSLLGVAQNSYHKGKKGWWANYQLEDRGKLYSIHLSSLHKVRSQIHKDLEELFGPSFYAIFPDGRDKYEIWFIGEPKSVRILSKYDEIGFAYKKHGYWYATYKSTNNRYIKLKGYRSLQDIKKRIIEDYDE